ncbi:hypothetical protein EG329_000841 [Mollisiaceae sp. DMI_Dod_QoI]|nr:hypothetical protein EG329_000841 [Helotiales sp. DMI_Dod_QoI]
MAAQTDNQPYYTLGEGVPLPRNDTVNQLSTNSGGGYVLLTSTQLIETIAHFSRERIPERTVHAKAAGARGFFEVTDDISDLTDAAFLNGIGKRSEVLCRISTVGPERGSADTVRDFRGFAIKFKTMEGNNDWVFNNQPVFFVRDPLKFPSLNRSHKRNPGTNCPDADMFWDFHINNPESIHALMFLFGDRGLPSSVRHVNAYSGNTYKFTKSDGSYHYVRIHFLTNQGIHYYTNSEAAEIAGTCPDKHLLDLQEAIKSGDCPSWNVYVQAIHPADIVKAPVNIFDMTKIWPHKLYPLRKVGRMVLNQNPENWFAEIEQAAFSPSTMVPGIEPSPDPMLQARMFAYPDAARYRLGVNYQFLPTNAANSQVYCPTERDGRMNFTKNYGADPNYVGSKLKPMAFFNTEKSNGTGQNPSNTSAVDGISLANTPDHAKITTPVAFASTPSSADFEQPKILWEIMSKQAGAQARFVNNLSAHLADAKLAWIREGAYGLFAKVDTDLSDRVRKTTEEKIKGQHKHPHKSAWH